MPDQPENFAELVGVFLGLIALVIPLIFSITLVVVTWKIIEAWILKSGDAVKIEEGKQTALIGIIALVIMAGVWGIIELLRSSLFG